MDDAKLSRLIDLLLAREEREAQDREKNARPSPQNVQSQDTMRLDTRGTTGLLQRLGWARKDQLPTRVSTRGQVSVQLADYSLMLQSPGDRTELATVNIPAQGVGNFGTAYLTPPLVGTWLMGIITGPSALTIAFEFWMSAALAVLAPAPGAVFYVLGNMPDPREPILLIGAELGLIVGGGESYHRIPAETALMFPHPIWWCGPDPRTDPLKPSQRNRLVISSFLENVEVHATLIHRGALNDLEMPHQS